MERIGDDDDDSNSTGSSNNISKEEGGNNNNEIGISDQNHDTTADRIRFASFDVVGEIGIDSVDLAVKDNRAVYVFTDKEGRSMSHQMLLNNSTESLIGNGKLVREA